MVYVEVGGPYTREGGLVSVKSISRGGDGGKGKSRGPVE